jgi:hypothetical protein
MVRIYLPAIIGGVIAGTLAVVDPAVAYLFVLTLVLRAVYLLLFAGRVTTMRRRVAAARTVSKTNEGLLRVSTVRGVLPTKAAPRIAPEVGILAERHPVLVTVRHDTAAKLDSVAVV